MRMRGGGLFARRAEVEPLYSKDYGAALEGLQEQTQNVFTRR